MSDKYIIDVPIDDIREVETSFRSISTARIAGFSRTGMPLVDVIANPAGRRIPARSCVPLNASDVGREVVIVQDPENRDSAIVLGIVHPAGQAPPIEVTADGQAITVHAENTLVLKCGEASITLNRNGKVVIRGKHVVTHATGVNRIRGGSVQLN